MKINILDGLPGITSEQMSCSYYSGSTESITMNYADRQQYIELKEKIQSREFVSDPLKEKIVAVIEEILMKIRLAYY